VDLIFSIILFAVFSVVLKIIISFGENPQKSLFKISLLLNVFSKEAE
jgi:hypothetical protein